MASPHTRGWTLPAAVAGEQPEGFPAHAGMDPTIPSRPRAPTGLPRTRGDGPAPLFCWPCRGWASPHTRGWTRCDEPAYRPGVGFPAHAGMDPEKARRRHARLGLPRTRGDGPSTSCSGTRGQRASPHTRGWTADWRPQRGDRYGFPAHAGMDPDEMLDSIMEHGLPRTRGDGPRAPHADAPRRAASPHTRGWTLVWPSSTVLNAGFPAHAGMDPARTAGATPCVRLPRTRGDGPSPPSRSG